MHEWALAEAIVVAAAEVAREHGMTAVEAVMVRLGELQDVDREAFAFGLSVIQAQTPLMEGAVFRFETEPAGLQCRPCGHIWLLRDSKESMSADDIEAIHLLPEAIHVYVVCPACGSPDFAVTNGRGVSLGSVQG